MKPVCISWRATLPLVIILLFGIPASASDGAIDKAIERYQNGYFEEARDQFQSILERADAPSVQKPALVYLSLIEIAFRDTKAADRYLTQLLKIDPTYPIEEKADATPDLIQRFRRVQSTLDLFPPTGEITGIRDQYTEGDQVVYTIKARDDTALRSVTFQIKDQPVREAWHVSGMTSTLQSAFFTEDWSPGTYTYSLRVEDKSDNVKEYTGQFDLLAKPDVTSPFGQVIGLKDAYTEGDPVRLTLLGEDDRGLKKMRFEIDELEVSKNWEILGQSASHEVSISTHGWKPGTYSYQFILEDQGGNRKTVSGDLVLKEKQYGYVNLFTRPWTTVYIDGKSVGNTPLARLKLPAGKVEIRFVNESKRIDVTKTVDVKSDEIVRKRFEWNSP